MGKLENLIERTHDPEADKRDRELLNRVQKPRNRLSIGQRNLIEAKKRESEIIEQQRLQQIETPNQKDIDDAQGTPHGTPQGTDPGTVQYTAPGSVPESVQGTDHGTVQGTPQYTQQSTPQYTLQGTLQGTVQAPKIDESKKPDDLSLLQFRLLYQIYFIRPFKASGKNSIGVPWGIKRSTISKSLIKLTKQGYISKPYAVHNGLESGSTCAVNEAKCIPLFGSTPIQNPPVKGIQTTPEEGTHQYTHKGTPQYTQHGTVPYTVQGTVHPSYNSSSSYNKTTTENPINESEVEQALMHPELDFWKEQGVKTRQIINGVNSAGVSLEIFIQSMKHYAHEKPKSEKPPMAHLIGGIKKNGIWAKKPDYKSYEERQLEIQNQVIAEKKARLEKLKASREAQMKVEQDLAFEEFLANPEDDFYKECFQSLAPNEQKKAKLGNIFSLKMKWMQMMGLSE